MPRTEPQDVADLALAAMDAAMRPELWPDLCDRVAGRMGAAAFMVFAYDLTDHTAPMAHTSAALRSPAADALVAAVQRGEDAEDHPNYRKLGREPAGRVVSEHDVHALPRDAPLPASAWRDRVLAVTRGQARSAMKLNDIGSFLDCAIAHDGAPHGAGPPPMAGLAPVLAPLLARTLEASRTVAALTRTYAALMTLFDRLDFGAAFAAPGARIVTANRAFRQMTAERDAIADRAGRLVAVQAAGASALRGVLAAAAHPAAPPAALTATLPRRSGGRPLVLRAAPVREADVGPEPLVLLLVIDPADGARLSGDGLAAFGLLTAAELDVCDLLVKGLGTEAIAEHRATSPETTRGQIKTAAAKLACRSRLDLVRLALASRAPVREAE